MAGLRPEDERLLFRARVVAVGVILFLLTFIVVFSFVTPLAHALVTRGAHAETGVPEALLIVIVPSLVGVLVPLLGIRTILNRKD